MSQDPTTKHRSRFKYGGWVRQAVMVALLTAASAVGVLVGACSPKSAEEQISSGKVYLKNGDTKAAVIEFKSALEQAPEAAPVRVLMAEALFAGGDPVSASVELKKAMAQGLAVAETGPLYARVLLALNDPKQVIELFDSVKLEAAEARDDLDTSLASAYALIGNLAAAKQRLGAVLASRPDHAAALVVKARFMLRDNNAAGAMEVLNALIGSKPGEVDARMLLGDVLLNVKNDLDAALAEYKKVVEIKPANIRAHSSVIGIFLRKKDIPAVKREIESLKSVAPASSQTKFHEAQLALLERNPSQAREIVQGLLRLAPEYVGLLHLAGLIETELGNQRQSRAHFAKALFLAPQRLDIRLLLAKSYLATGQAEKALEALRPALARETVDGRTLAIAAEAYLQLGDLNRARETYQRAVQVLPSDTSIRASLAMMDIASGNIEAGNRQLQALSAGETSSIVDRALITSKVSQRDFDGALKAIDVLAQKDVDPALPPYLRGRVYALKGDGAASRKALEASLMANKTYFPAARMLADLDLEDGKPELAKQRYESQITADASNVKAMIALARLRARAGAPKDEVVQRIAAAIKVDPLDSEPRLAMVDYLLSQRSVTEAVQAAQEALALQPEAEDLLQALGRAQMNSGDVRQAVTTFKKLAQLRPRSAEPLIQMAQVHLRLNDAKAAQASLRQALTVAPDSDAAQRLLVGELIKAKQIDQALAVSRDVQKRNPAQAGGYLLESSIHQQAKRPDAALAVLRAGLAKAPSTELAVSLHGLLATSTKGAEAPRFAAEWLKSHATDAVFLRHLGDQEMRQHNYAGAELRYREAIKTDPDQAPVLNNLAWVALKLSRADALSLAERAVQAEPSNPAILDTLARALVAAKQPERAKATALRAIGLSPGNIPILLSAVQTLVDVGANDLAELRLSALADGQKDAFVLGEIARLRAGMKR